MAQRLVIPVTQLFDNIGLLAPGWKIKTYEAGTTTPLATYSDIALTIANPTTVIVDSAGRLPINMYVDDNSRYKIVITDENDIPVPSCTFDPADPYVISLEDLDPRPASYWGITTGTSTQYELVANPIKENYSSNDFFLLTFHTPSGNNPTLKYVATGPALPLNKYNNDGTLSPIMAGQLQNQRYLATNNGSVIIILNPTISSFSVGDLITRVAPLADPAAFNALYCNGALVSKTSYPALYNLLGDTWGVQTATQFYLPDFRGMFLRGMDDGRGIDPGRVLGAQQGFAMQNVVGTFRAVDPSITNASGAFTTINRVSSFIAGGGAGDFWNQIINFTLANQVQTASETRPINQTVYYYIKYA